MVPMIRRLGRFAVPLMTALLVVGAFSALPPGPAAGLACLGSAGFAVAIFWAVRAGRAQGPPLRALALASGVLLTAVAAASAGIAAVAAPDALVADVPLRAEIPLVSLFFVAGAFLVGVLHPRQARGPLTRVRVALDGLSLALGLVYTPWLLVFSAGERRGAAITAILLGAPAIAAVAVTGLHAVRQRAALLWCGLGTGLSLVGLTALVVALDYLGLSNAPMAAGAAAFAINAGAAMIWYGTVRVHPDARPVPPAGTDPSSGHPLLVLPLIAAALATGYHLVHDGRLDAVTIVLGVAGVIVLATREYLTARTLRRHAVHLADQGDRLRSLVFGSSDVALVLDEDQTVRWQSPAAARQFGLSDHDVVGRPVSSLLHPEDAPMFAEHLAARTAPHAGIPAEPFEVRLRDGFGAWRSTEWTVNGPDPASPGRSLVVHVRDVSESRKLEQTLRQAAYVDRQTSLANRQGLRRAGEPVPDTGALIVIELTGMPGIIDVHGPDLGEAVLVEAARRLRAELESTDVPARLGESRFAVLTRCGAVRAHLLASRLLNVLSAPYTAPGTVAHLSAYAGLADLTAQADIDEVIRRAGLALRAIGPGRPGAIDWYDHAMEIQLVRRSALEQDLPHAIGRGELDLSYQPIVDLPSGRPVGVEALLRWRHRSLGTVSPTELLPVAEDLGLLGEIGQWVMHWACRQLSSWRLDNPDLWIAVNVRTRQLTDPVFLAAVNIALETHQIPPSALIIEVAEPDLMAVRDDSAHRSAFRDVVAHLGQLRAMGVRTAVDNFGTGPTSLSQLRILPIDFLKIDREVFEQPTARAGQTGAIVDVIVKLSRQLGIDVIAQRMETPADLETVQAAGCRLGQGFLVGHPVPAEHLEAQLDRFRDVPRQDR